MLTKKAAIDLLRQLLNAAIKSGLFDNPDAVIQFNNAITLCDGLQEPPPPPPPILPVVIAKPETVDAGANHI